MGYWDNIKLKMEMWNCNNEFGDTYDSGNLTN
jgi:hypothetical protein